MRRHALQRPLRIAQMTSLAASLLLAACRTAPPPDARLPAPAVAMPPRRGASPPATPRPTLAAEQARLAALFRGTPVAFALQTDGSLRVDVPLLYCFDAGQSAVKPPLAAVLVQVALSQEDGSSRIVVAAPGDALLRGQAGKAALARRDRLAGQRAANVRDHLTTQGLADSRVTIAAAVTEPAGRAFVTLVVSDSLDP